MQHNQKPWVHIERYTYKFFFRFIFIAAGADHTAQASDISTTTTSSGNNTSSSQSSSSTTLYQSHHQQHIFQHQSSVASTTSIQTVLHQSHHINNNGQSSASGSVHESHSSASFHSLSLNGVLSAAPAPTATSLPVSSTNCLPSNIVTLQQQQQNHIHKQMSASSYQQGAVADEALSIGDVADLLHPQFAIITGGRSREGCSLITFPDHNNFHTLTENDYNKLIFYLTSVPS